MNKCICDLKDKEEKLISKGCWVDLYIEKKIKNMRL